MFIQCPGFLGKNTKGLRVLGISTVRYREKDWKVATSIRRYEIYTVKGALMETGR